MSVLKRPAFWLGTFGSMGVFYITLALVINDVLPSVFGSISVGIVFCTMISTWAYILVTNSYRKYDAQQTAPEKDTE